MFYSIDWLMMIDILCPSLLCWLQDTVHFRRTCLGTSDLSLVEGKELIANVFLKIEQFYSCAWGQSPGTGSTSVYVLRDRMPPVHRSCFLEGEDSKAAGCTSIISTRTT